jgi:small-conductance mechanosensitive channel
METLVFNLKDSVWLFAVRGAVSLLVFLLFWFAGVALQKIIRRLSANSALSTKDVLDFLGRIAKGGLIVFGVVTALGTAGINVSALVAGLGLMGFALGFALRDALSNLLAGALILIYRPFQRNDAIAVAGFEGTVVDIDLRYTTLQAEGKKFLLPNSLLFTHAISLVERKT